METRPTYNCAHLRSTKEGLTFEYFEKEIIFFCRGEEKPGRKRWKIFGEGKYIFLDALASLEFKLSASQSVNNRFQIIQ